MAAIKYEPCWAASLTAAEGSHPLHFLTPAFQESWCPFGLLPGLKYPDQRPKAESLPAGGLEERRNLQESHLPKQQQMFKTLRAYTVTVKLGCLFMLNSFPSYLCMHDSYLDLNIFWDPNSLEEFELQYFCAFSFQPFYSTLDFVKQ